MKNLLLFSIALSMFLIGFSNADTRVDEAFTALKKIDPFLYGDLLLASGAAIVLAIIVGLIGAILRFNRFLGTNYRTVAQQADATASKPVQ